MGCWPSTNCSQELSTIYKVTSRCPERLGHPPEVVQDVGGRAETQLCFPGPTAHMHTFDSTLENVPPEISCLTSPLDSDSLGGSHPFLIRQRKWWDVSDNSLGDLKRGCTGDKIYHDFLYSLSTSFFFFFFGIDLEKKEELRIHLEKTLLKD